MPTEASSPANRAAAVRPSSTCSYSCRTSQWRRPPAVTGTFGKRCTSSIPRRSPSSRPTTTRPLWAPMSTAAIVVMGRCLHARAEYAAGRSGDVRGCVLADLGDDHFDAVLVPGAHLVGRSALVGDDRLHGVGRDERQQRAPVPFVPSTIAITRSQASAICCLMRTSSGLRSMRPRSTLRPRAPRKPLLMRVAFSSSTAEIADERHGREPEHPAGDEHVDAGRVRQRSCDEDPVGDDDELALGAELEREVVGGRARIEGDRLAVADELRRLAGDRTLPVDVEPEAKVEAELRLAAVERPHAAAYACNKSLPRKLGEVAANRDLRNRKGFRKFRNLNGIARLEHLQHLLHPLALGQTWQVLRVSGTILGLLRQEDATLRRSWHRCQASSGAYETRRIENQSLTTTTSNRRGPWTPSTRAARCPRWRTAPR